MEKNADGEKMGTAKASAEHSRLPKKVHWAKERLFRYIAERGSDFMLSRQKGKHEPLAKTQALAMLDDPGWVLVHVASYAVKFRRPELGDYHEFQIVRADDLSAHGRGYFTGPRFSAAREEYLAGERARKKAAVAGQSAG